MLIILILRTHFWDRPNATGWLPPSWILIWKSQMPFFDLSTFIRLLPKIFWPSKWDLNFKLHVKQHLDSLRHEHVTSSPSSNSKELQWELSFLKYPIYNSVDPSILSWCATSPTKILMLNQMSQHCVLTSSCWIQLLLLPLERTSFLHRTRVQHSHRLDCGTKFE